MPCGWRDRCWIVDSRYEIISQQVYLTRADFQDYLPFDLRSRIGCRAAIGPSLTSRTPGRSVRPYLGGCLMFGSIGMPELIIIFVIGLIVFGPSKLPELGKSLGEAIRGFKKSVSDSERLPAEKSDNADHTHNPSKSA